MPGVTVVQVTSLESQRWCPLVKRQSHNELQEQKMFRTPKLSYGMLLPSPRSQPRTQSYVPPLLRLPVELRQYIIRLTIPSLTETLRIYTDVDPAINNALWRTQRPPFYRDDGNPRQFTSPHARYRTPHAKSYHAFQARFARDALAVLRINRQIYAEALPVLYSGHMFHFVGYSYLPVLQFFRNLGPEARAVVRRVRMSMLGCEHEGAPTEVMIGFDDGTEAGQVVSKNQHVAEALCSILHEYLPGLTVLRADPWVYT